MSSQWLKSKDHSHWILSPGHSSGECIADLLSQVREETAYGLKSLLCQNTYLLQGDY